MSTETQTIQKNVTKLNEMILAGDVIKAFEEFYHPNVVMQENTQNPTVGFEANLAREKDFVSKVKWNHADVLSLIVDGEKNRSVVEWEIDYVHKEWGHIKTTQASVQTWKDGKIIHERFYYSVN
ncbi:SnoaL-like domain protein [Leptospira yasudae]|uniref:Nuclear transport factor 2 family protein n=1 Tax=Leptospira yasudae TaxID=2202201 RepID=A0A6N4QJH7_9LEPT|nr:nuclear transport factor 2 family protein [Leptospira yasudae]MBW0434217.1 nuclear transport factor 2 family protein [Leptospira yasudae]RHX91281.1 SnoaL-like domain protein [Leptospira yasudae]TGL80305.1 nuclear transport factor 2 family protein [Leptospira yasudae]TGL82182.1 nuclear transport factor 2 family protein [Leptospira yasudae]TGL87004.1 nuclear transport factor 2 family protein [Leptospira yasudae]